MGSITINGYHWNRPAEMTVPGGSKKIFEYDPLMRIRRITDKDPGQNVVMDYQYTYDKMDNILAKNTEHGNYAYGYDDLHRLTTVDNPNFSDEAFSYDPVGNRLTSTGITGNWSYNGNNELLGYDGISYKYDANGNTIQKNDNGIIADYSYDIKDRLVEVTTNNPQPITYRYYYDPFGRRLWKEVDGTRTYFMYSDEGLIAELDSSGNITKSYGYKPNSTWKTDPLFMKVSTDYYFYHNDHLGTSHKLTAINGSVVWSAKYSSFGEATIDPNSTVTNNLRFPGQYYDKETGLHYNWHRYYDPRTGRYLRADPSHTKQARGTSIPYFLPFLLHTRKELNTYTYAQNNPIKIFDTLALKANDAENGNCEAALGECTEHAVKNEVLCATAVGLGTGICYAGCSLACITLSGPAMPACLATCSATCASFGEAGMVACSIILTAELEHCAYEYNRCKCPSE